MDTGGMKKPDAPARDFGPSLARRASSSVFHPWLVCPRAAGIPYDARASPRLTENADE